MPLAQWLAGASQQTQNSFPPGSAITGPRDKMEGYAAGAAGSGAWIGTWCVVLGCTLIRRQPTSLIVSS